MKKKFVLSLVEIIIFLIIICFIIFVLEFCGYITLPEEYSFMKLFNVTEETIYIPENIEVGNTVVKWKKVLKKSNSDSNARLNISKYDDSKKIENKDKENIYKRFYYSQLDNEAKKLYEGIINNLDKIKTGMHTIDFGKEFNDLLNSDGGEEKLNDYFQSAVNALLLDNPEVFYLDITKLFLLTKTTTFAFSGTTYEVSIGPNNNESYLSKGFDKNDVEEAERKVKNIKDEIIKITEGREDIEKIKIVHDYLVDNLEYDSTFANSNIYNMYGALVNNLTVCEGYAKSFKSIMDDLNIPCVVVCGIARNSKGNTENHAWDYCLIDNNWYAIDVTWDDPIVVGGGEISDKLKYKYFLKGSEDFFEDHFEDGNIVNGATFSYPTLNDSNY